MAGDPEQEMTLWWRAYALLLGHLASDADDADELLEAWWVVDYLAGVPPDDVE